MTNEITVHALLEHQEPAYQSSARFKLMRCGRRWGKDAFAEHVSLLGHGPETGAGPLWKGLIHGRDVVWLAPTIPQALALWQNEVEPRFRHRENVRVNKNEKTVSFMNGDGTPFATLWVRSAEAIDSVRGIGKRLGGVVINEAAHMDLEAAWRDVLRPTLMDCGAWAIIMSTTNAGSDGHQTEVGARTPSYFNILSDEIEQGRRGPEWEEFYGTAQDNPKIPPEEFKALVEEYPPDSVTLAQEVYAKKVVGGAGLAFPELAEDAHTARYLPEQDPRYRWSGGGDWGYRKPGGLWLMATGPERSLVRWEYYFREKTPYDVGYQWIVQTRRFPRPEYMAIDAPAVSDGGPTILEELQKGMRDACQGKEVPPLISPPLKGPGSRFTKTTLLHDFLKYTRAPDGVIPPWGYPRLQIHKDDCPNLWRTLQALPRDPKNPELVDENAEDHPFDGLTSWIMARTPHVEREKQEKRDPNAHPGFDDKGRRKDTRSPLPTVQTGQRWSRNAR